jgi:hypothetical protein
VHPLATTNSFRKKLGCTHWSGLIHEYETILYVSGVGGRTLFGFVEFATAN